MVYVFGPSVKELYAATEREEGDDEEDYFVKMFARNFEEEEKDEAKREATRVFEEKIKDAKRVSERKKKEAEKSENERQFRAKNGLSKKRPRGQRPRGAAPHICPDSQEGCKKKDRKKGTPMKWYAAKDCWMYEDATSIRYVTVEEKRLTIKYKEGILPPPVSSKCPKRVKRQRREIDFGRCVDLTTGDSDTESDTGSDTEEIFILSRALSAAGVMVLR
jgi:hypothetical protein